MALPTYTPGPVAPHQSVPQGSGHNHTLTIHVKRPKPKAARAKTAPKPDPLSLPAGPGSSYTVGQLRQLVNAAADEKFGPQQRALQARQQAIPGWFEAYRNAIGQAAAAQQQRTTDAVTALQGLAGSAGAVDPNASPEAQAAARVRAGLAGGQTQLAQIQGDNQKTFLDNLGLLTNINQIAELSKAGSALDELGRQRADYGQTYGQQLLSDEAKSKLEQAAFGLNVAKAKATTIHQQNQDARARGNARRQSQKLTDAEKKDAYQRAHHLGPYKPAKPSAASTKDQFGNTPKDIQRNNDSWDKAKTTATYYWNHGKASFKNDWRQLADFLITSKNINPLYARAAAQRIARAGHAVDPALATKLRRRGVKVKVANGPAQAQMIDNTIATGLGNIGGN